MKLFWCKIWVITRSKSAKYLVWWVYWMKNKCLLLATFCTFQTPLTLLTYSALVHTTSNLVWFLITDYGEQLGCPWGWSWRSSQIWGSWSQRYLFDLKDHHKYQARWGILATVFLSSPQSFGIISVKIWRIRLQRIERMIMTPKWKTLIMMIFTKNLSDLSNFQDQIE